MHAADSPGSTQPAMLRTDQEGNIVVSVGSQLTSFAHSLPPESSLGHARFVADADTAEGMHAWSYACSGLLCILKYRVPCLLQHAFSNHAT